MTQDDASVTPSPAETGPPGTTRGLTAAGSIGAVTRALDRLDALIARLLLPLTVGGLVLGLALSWAGNEEAATWCWAVPSFVVGAWLAASIVRDLLHGEAGVDLIAVLAIGGALLLGEALAAAVIGVMLATGEWLERYAAGRANKELSALVSRAPRVVHRYRDGGIEDREIADVAMGDRLLVKPGEVVPVDGTVIGDPAVLDESALTGESRLATREAGDPVSSGTVNAGAPFDLLATATAEHSTYAGIVRLVKEAQTSKAPFVRMADRYAILFVPLTLVVAGVAWAISGDPVRALAVLVVATPVPAPAGCPDRHRLRHQPLREARHHRQGRRRARGARPGPGHALRQDRHADGRPTAPGRGRDGT